MHPFKRYVLAATVPLVLISISVAQDASKPNKRGRVNLLEAQRLCSQAYDKITDAQKFNAYDLDGHAKKAKALLQQANEELKLAAKSANGKADAKSAGTNATGATKASNSR